MRRWLQAVWVRWRAATCSHRNTLPETVNGVRVLRCQRCWLLREKPFTTDVRASAGTTDPRFVMSRRENARLRWRGLVEVRQRTPSAAIVKERSKAS